MLKKNISSWTPNIFNRFEIFTPLLPQLQHFYDRPCWPTVLDYNQLSIARNIKSDSDKLISFVEQYEKSDDFENQYEPRIYLKGEVLSRPQNWHDFFNAMIWLTFPKTKAQINAQQYQALKTRLGISKTRTMLENVLTLFDENGAIVISHNEALLNLLKDFCWKDLFWRHRELVKTQMRCYVFGHSLYEKWLNPYVGLTASSLLFLVSKKFFDKDLSEQLLLLDEKLANFFKKGGIALTKEFVPLPVLGYPGWHDENNHENYYDNTAYFRSKKHDKKIYNI